VCVCVRACLLHPWSVCVLCLLCPGRPDVCVCYIPGACVFCVCAVHQFNYTQIHLTITIINFSGCVCNLVQFTTEW